MSGLGRRPFVPDQRDFPANRLRTLIRSRQATPKSWTIDRVLDQGSTPHCVGFGCADYGNCLPVDDEYTDADGHALYYEACEIGGYPNTEDGANVRDGLKALRARDASLPMLSYPTPRRPKNGYPATAPWLWARIGTLRWTTPTPSAS